MKSKKWIYLSYELSDKFTSYGNGDRISAKPSSKICCGASNNSTNLKFNSHFGTHIDFPYHFSDSGKKGELYDPEKFIFDWVQVICLENNNYSDYLIKQKNIMDFNFDKKTEFLIIKTGFCNIRHEREYWENYPGIHADLAKYFKERMPNLRAIGLDTISISSYQNRSHGRIAHKKFLIENNILIVEDMNLKLVNNNSRIDKLIVSPLRFKNSDGAPTTIFANIDSI